MSVSVLKRPLSVTFEKPLVVLLLTVGFLLALGLRIIIGGVGLAHSPVAGLVFAGMLIGFVAIVGVSTKLTKKTALIGVIGGVVLCLPAGLHAIGAQLSPPLGNYIAWAGVVSIVACAEEVFLRGALFDAVASWRGENWAIIITALLFALLHLPLYGWHAVPLDFVVGIWLGLLRTMSGSWVAPGIAHVFADLASWWLV